MAYTCEFCNKVSETKPYGSGRFCSQSCACKFSARAKQQQKEAAKLAEKVDGGIKGQSQQVNNDYRSQKEVIKQASCSPDRVVQEVTTITLASDTIMVHTDRVIESKQSLQDKFNEVPRYVYKKIQRTREFEHRLGDRDMTARKQQIIDLYPVQSWVCTDEQLDRLISRLSGQG